jgi:hypothetical protein
MIAAIMQPYLFPYIGYFQLMHAVDTFVLYDDVQYSKNGWINRNLVRQNGAPAWLTLPVRKMHLGSLINERRYALDGTAIDDAKRLVDAAYRKAPAFDATREMLDRLWDHGDDNVARFNANALTALTRQLGLRCRLLVSSAIPKDPALKAEARVVDICRRIGATRYINAIGGIDLYHADAFAGAGIELSFLKTSMPMTELAGGTLHLSIIDLLMHSGIAGTADAMTRYKLIEPRKPAAQPA